MNSAAAKNLAMSLATGSYKGLKSIGKSIRKVPGKVLNRIENVERLRNDSSNKIKLDNFGK